MNRFDICNVTISLYIKNKLDASTIKYYNAFFAFVNLG